MHFFYGVLGQVFVCMKCLALQVQSQARRKGLALSENPLKVSEGRWTWHSWHANTRTSPTFVLWALPLQSVISVVMCLSLVVLRIHLQAFCKLVTLVYCTETTNICVLWAWPGRSVTWVLTPRTHMDPLRHQLFRWCVSAPLTCQENLVRFGSIWAYLVKNTVLRFRSDESKSWSSVSWELSNWRAAMIPWK